jgi:hypothetical protein
LTNVSGAQRPIDLEWRDDITHFGVCNEPRPGLLCKVWLRCHARDVFNLAVAFVRVRDLWHGPVTRWLPELRYLEGTDHNEDVAPTLDGTDGARRV